MSRTTAKLPEGSRVTDHISLGVIAKQFPQEKVRAILQETGKVGQRDRQLPSHVVVYYVIALALYMQVSYGEVLRCLLEGIKWLWPKRKIKVTGKSGISQARRRVGVEPLRRLQEEIVVPIGLKKTRGTYYRNWRVVSIDGSTLDVADTEENETAFGRPGASRGASGFPQIRFVSLVENGTHVLFGTEMGGYAMGEFSLSKKVLSRLQKGMLCIGDRNFYSYDHWQQAAGTGAALLWRMKKNMRLPCERRLKDGSYLSRVYPSDKDRRHGRRGCCVRVIEYTLEGVPDAEPLYRLITTILDEDAAPAKELACLYHERWEIETALDELKTHLRGRKIVLRSKKPDLVRQEFYGLLMAHFAIRGLMHEAALKHDRDPDSLSFVHAVRVIRRKLPFFSSDPPKTEGSIS